MDRDYLDDLSERLGKLTPPNRGFEEAVEALKRTAGCGSMVKDALLRAMDALEAGNSREFKDSIEKAFAYQEAVSLASKEAEEEFKKLI